MPFARRWRIYDYGSMSAIPYGKIFATVARIDKRLSMKLLDDRRSLGLS
jgi:hypothetical protein